ncbi:hypothetical protein I7I48_11987 [Histoplasma ohiense]|nr:hypothetical protein I7I48_11987 [Histoplasma ohiense (nom. inval.)]
MKLSSTEEDRLVEWILDQTKKGFPLQSALIEDTANYLLTLQNFTTSTTPLSTHWQEQSVKSSGTPFRASKQLFQTL